MRLYILLLLSWIPCIWSQRETPPTFQVCLLVPPIPPNASPISPKLQRFADLLARTWTSGKERSSRFDFRPQKYKQAATKPIRKEYRQMTNKERNLFHQALKDMYKSLDWHKLVNEHRDNYAPAAHGGFAFTGWHRQYLHVLEKYLRGLKVKYRNVYIPYWDTALDVGLPDPRHSALWTKYYWGKNKKKVTNGKLCQNWVTTPICHPRSVIVYRNILTDPSMLFSRESISNLNAINTFAAWAPRFESEHGAVHCYLGRCPSRKSHISDLTCAPNDPVFFIYHAFLDCLFDEWQDENGDAIYPWWAPSPHGPNDPMDPFPGLRNIDGHRKDFYNTCRERPSKIQCKNDGDCDSPPGLLFCHQCLCMGKIREKGNCNGMDDKACYCHNNGTPKCSNNKCKCE